MDAHGEGGDPGSSGPAVVSYGMLRGAGTPAVAFERHDVDTACGCARPRSAARQDQERDTHPRWTKYQLGDAPGVGSCTRTH